MTDGPVFFAGIDRSGIGMLAEALEAHPDMAVTRRLNFWDFYAGRFGDLAEPANLARCLDAMLAYTRIRRLQPDPAALRDQFEQGERSYPRLFRLLQEQNRDRLGARRWADKSLGSEQHAEAILTAFPDAVMLHVIRDPRDRYASQAGHRTAGRGGVGSGTALWLWSARAARKNRRRFPGRYLPVRYEDLATDPEATLRIVSDFTGLTFTTAMLCRPGPDETFTTKSIGRYRHDLAPTEIRFIEWIAGREMARWGYRPSRTRPGLREWLRSGLRLVPALAGLVLWWPVTLVRRRAGAKPSARRTLP